MSKIVVKVNGVEYTLKATEDEAYLQNVASFVDKKINTILEKNKRLSSSDVAVLAAMNVADELFKWDKYIEELEEKNKVLTENEKLHISNVEKLQNEKNDFDKILEEKKKQLNTKYINIIENKEKEVSNLKEKLKNNSGNSEKIKSLETRVEELSKKNKELEENNKGLKEKCNKLNDELTEASTSRDELNKKVMQISNKLTLLSNEKKEVEAQVYDCKEEINQKKEKITELIKSAHNKNLQIEKLKAELDNLKNTGKANLTKETNSLGLKIKNLSEQLKGLESTLATKESEIQELREAGLAFREAAATVNNEDRENLIRELEELEIQSKGIIRKNELLLKDNKDLRFNYQSTRYKVMDLEKKYMESQIEVAKLKDEKNKKKF